MVPVCTVIYASQWKVGSTYGIEATQQGLANDLQSY